MKQLGIREGEAPSSDKTLLTLDTATMLKAFDEALTVHSVGIANTVKLDIGGEKTIKVSREVLMQFPKSKFDKMFKKTSSLPADSDGAVFIDQSPEIFMPLINFLRAKRCDKSKSPPSIADFGDKVELFKDFLRML